jgi:hypothetical protein
MSLTTIAWIFLGALFVGWVLCVAASRGEGNYGDAQ